MHQILIMGAGKIGSLIAFLLARSNDYKVHLADMAENNPAAHYTDALSHFQYVQLNAKDAEGIAAYINKHNIQAIISSLPFYCNVDIAKVAAKHNIHYFDLTEDVETTQVIHELSQKANGSFVSQSGLAPGFISIVANDLMKEFEELDTVKMRVGALPANISNVLQYSLTWSTDGLINEYGNPCHAIKNYQDTILLPLEGLENINLDGLPYEAFNTSGGVGSLAKTFAGKVKNLNYKTVRYPGHCRKIKLLMNDLKLNEDRETLKRIFENAMPKTYQDVVLVYVSVSGKERNQFIEKNYFKKFYPKVIGGHHWSAIQLTTASEVCAVMDIVFSEPKKYAGFVLQEQFSLDEVLNNRFGGYYAA